MSLMILKMSTFKNESTIVFNVYHYEMSIKIWPQGKAG